MQKAGRGRGRWSGIPASPESFRIVENHAKGMAVSCAYATHSMAKIDAVHAARAAHGPMMNCKDHCIALAQRNHLRPRLHPRPLLCEHELPAGKILAGLRQQDCDLQWEHMLPVEVLVQTVVVLGPVLEQQWRRPGLSRRMATRQVFGVRLRILNVDTHRGIPSI